MSLSLHDSWVKRLGTAQLDQSWHAQVEARVLRFLLSRYHSTSEEAALADFLLQEGDAPHGRAHEPLSKRQLQGRLNHIATTATEAQLQPPSVLDRAFEAHTLWQEEPELARELVADVLVTYWTFLNSRWRNDAQYQYEEDRRKQREHNRW